MECIGLSRGLHDLKEAPTPLFKVKIRGIYSTALTRLLMDRGFKIVQPSAVIKERFNLKNPSQEPPDLDIRDRMDRQGVCATGSIGALQLLTSTLNSTLDDVVIRGRIPREAGGPILSSEEFGNPLLKSLSETTFTINIEFPALSKRILDSIRRKVQPTLDGHHYYKACGRRISSLLEMAERLLEKGCPQEEVEALFKETIRSEYPRVGSIIEIEHVKIDGRCFHLGVPRVLRFEEETGVMRLHRTFTKKGVYDGLKTVKEPGDHAVTDLKIGGWSLRTRYFSSKGVYKGTYINLNTPVELYPRGIRYVDLEVDICVWPDGKIAEIDMEKLQERIRQGYISERIEPLMRREIKEIMNTISLDLEKDEAALTIEES